MKKILLVLCTSVCIALLSACSMSRKQDLTVMAAPQSNSMPAHAAVTVHAFQGWLRSYGNAWTTGNPDEVILLFSQDARYYETPFDAPMTGRDAIRKYWAEGAKYGQSNVNFHVNIISLENNIGVAHWQATFNRVPSGEFVELDGILQATFDSQGECVEFKEWWHRKESEKNVTLK